MKIKKNLVLLGMMGVGKSTIGRYVAKKLKIKFFDIDKIIEKENKMRIKEIFETAGETYFRKKEESVTLKYLDVKESVISLGGGAFVNEKIRAKVLSDCFSVWINLNFETLYKRLKKNKKRPLINNKDSNNIRKILLERKKIYSEADQKINCDNLSLDQTVNRIIEIYE
mgnify:CR=1 FL=1|tara:strand:+ start:357 stop:863 length:507 start_codon:yes stop_codon:yes gene_type:complete